MPENYTQIYTESLDPERRLRDGLALALGTPRRPIQGVVEPVEPAVATLGRCHEEPFVAGIDRLCHVADVLQCSVRRHVEFVGQGAEWQWVLPQPRSHSLSGRCLGLAHTRIRVGNDIGLVGAASTPVGTTEG